MERPTVLIVANNDFQVRLMTELLEANDLRIVRASAASEVATTTREVLPELVVLDLELPVSETHRVLQGLRQGTRTRGIPILAVGDKPQQALNAGVLANCVGEVIAKPIDTGAFPRRVLKEIRRLTNGTGREALL